MTSVAMKDLSTKKVSQKRFKDENRTQSFYLQDHKSTWFRVVGTTPFI